MNKKIATIDAVPNVDVSGCFTDAIVDPRFDQETWDHLYDFHPNTCPLLSVRAIGRTAALRLACEDCPVFNQIQDEEQVIEERMELAEEILCNPAKTMKEMSDLYTKGLRNSDPACEKKIIAELLQLTVVLDSQGRTDFLRSGQNEVNGSEQIQALMTYVDRCKMGRKQEEAEIATALIGVLRNIPGMYFRQLAASNGRANGEKTDTLAFTTVTGNLYSYCTLRGHTTLTELRDLVEAGKPNIRHSGIDAIADAQIQGTKGEIAVGKAVVGMNKTIVRRGTAEEDRQGGDFVLDKGKGKKKSVVFLDVKCRGSELSVRSEPIGNGIKLIIPETCVSEALTLSEKAEKAVKQQVLSLA